jgi:hypothetical protein
MGAHIHTTVQTDHIYISIDELQVDPILNQRASNVAGGQPLLSNVSGTFATLISRADVPLAPGHAVDTYMYTFENQYPIVSQYLSPLQNLSTLTFKIYDQNGDLLTPNGDPNHFILSFITRRRMVESL